MGCVRLPLRRVCRAMHRVPVIFRFIHVTPGSTVPPRTLGLGVTSTELARRCDMGNVNGLHGAARWPFGGDLAESAEVSARFKSWRGRSVVGIATEIPLPDALCADERCRARHDHHVTLAIEHLSLPTIAAAAVLALRSLGLAPCDSDQWGRDAARYRSRIAAIAAPDTRRPSAEWQPRPLLSKEQPWPADPRTAEEDEQLAAVAAICAAPIGTPCEECGGKGRWRGESGPVECWRCYGSRVEEGPRAASLSIAERVAIVACWLLWGEEQIGEGHMQGVWTILEACGVNRARVDITAALRSARERVEASRRALAEVPRRGELEGIWSCEEPMPSVIDVFDPNADRPAKIAIVHSPHPAALELGFCVAPVVVWINGKQATVAGWPGADGQTTYVHMARLCYELNVRERERDRMATWSHADETVISPEGGTRLSEDEIVGEVLGCLR
jgi:hypothetical protein